MWMGHKEGRGSCGLVPVNGYLFGWVGIMRMVLNCGMHA